MSESESFAQQMSSVYLVLLERTTGRYGGTIQRGRSSIAARADGLAGARGSLQKDYVHLDFQPLFLLAGSPPKTLGLSDLSVPDINFIGTDYMLSLTMLNV